MFDFLIHEKEAEEWRRNNPEPQEIKDIRVNIRNMFSDLEFVDEGHHYYLPNSDGLRKELMSVSAFTEQFGVPVDWDKKVVECARKRGVDSADLKRSWDENNLIATNNGTSTHLYGEGLMDFLLGNIEGISPILKPQMEKGYLVPYSGKQRAVMNFYKDVIRTKNFYPIMAETRVYMGCNNTYKIKKQGYAGTFDMLFAFKSHNGWKLSILDYKTNRSLENSYIRSIKQNMLPPFDDMYDEPLSHYSIQLSAYQLALQQLGYTIADRKIIWLKDDGTYEKVSVPDMSGRILEYLQA
ncbi:MAG: hypothetical protein LUD72_06250 [Bacteroidales bacterium]|nr:hypothetical protein [Bacteroidales bacterium]